MAEIKIRPTGVEWSRRVKGERLHRTPLNMTLRDARITLRSSFTYHCIIGAAESPAAFFHDDRNQPGKESDLS